MSGCQMVEFSISGLETRPKCLFYGLKCLVFKWSALLQEKTIWKLDKKVSEKLNVQISGVWLSDGYCSKIFSYEKQSSLQQFFNLLSWRNVMCKWWLKWRPQIVVKKYILFKTLVVCAGGRYGSHRDHGHEPRHHQNSRHQLQIPSRNAHWSGKLF